MSGVDLGALEARLKQYGQEHLLRFWPQLSPSEKAEYAKELDA
jgi:hypothetical protein